MHPLVTYAVYVLIALVLASYLARAKGDGKSIRPGSVFVVQLWVRIFAAVFFLGFPGLFFFIAPTTTRPMEAYLLAVILLGVFSIAYLFLITGRIEITDCGLKVCYLRWVSIYRFDEFARVSVYRFNIVLERKQGGANNLTFPAIFTNLADLHEYLRREIQGSQKTQAKPNDVSSGLDS